MSIRKPQIQFTLDTEKLTKYKYGMQNNIITFTIPTTNPNIDAELKIEIESVYNYTVKKMFVSGINSDKGSLLQFRNKIKTALNKGV